MHLKHNLLKDYIVIEIGQKAPDFIVKNQAGEERTLATYAGQKLVIYFYPKDDTSGCTTEAKDFTAMLPEFTAKNAHVIGVSRDSIASHCKFIAKHELGELELLSQEQSASVSLSLPEK